jgi:probable F420-dependent oxidoreductase
LLDVACTAGFTELWSGEVASVDAFSPLVAAAVSHPGFGLGTAIISAFTRGPAVIASSVAALCELSTGPVSVGIGASSDVIVEQWNGVSFDRPVDRVADVVSFLRRAFAGEKVTMRSTTLEVSGFRLGVELARPPRVLVAALRPQMLRLAGRAADGAILNWLAPSDVPRVLTHVHESRPDTEPAPEIVARLFVIADGDPAQARRVAKRMTAAYVTVPAYAAYQRFLGRGAQFESMWRLWADGDRAGAADAVPDEVVDELFVHGSPRACRARIDEYVAAGVTVPVLHVVGDLSASVAVSSIAALGGSS